MSGKEKIKLFTHFGGASVCGLMRTVCVNSGGRVTNMANAKKLVFYNFPCLVKGPLVKARIYAVH